MLLIFWFSQNQKERLHIYACMEMPPLLIFLFSTLLMTGPAACTVWTRDKNRMRKKSRNNRCPVRLYRNNRLYTISAKKQERETSWEKVAETRTKMVKGLFVFSTVFMEPVFISVNIPIYPYILAQLQPANQICFIPSNSNQHLFMQAQFSSLSRILYRAN